MDEYTQRAIIIGSLAILILAAHLAVSVLTWRYLSTVAAIVVSLILVVVTVAIWTVVGGYYALVIGFSPQPVSGETVDAKVLTSTFWLINDEPCLSLGLYTLELCLPLKLPGAFFLITVVAGNLAKFLLGRPKEK